MFNIAIINCMFSKILTFWNDLSESQKPTTWQPYNHTTTTSLSSSKTHEIHLQSWTLFSCCGWGSLPMGELWLVWAKTLLWKKFGSSTNHSCRIPVGGGWTGGWCSKLWSASCKSPPRLLWTPEVTQPGYPGCQGILQPGGGALLDFVGHAQYVTSTSSTKTRWILWPQVIEVVEQGPGTNPPSREP